jgi:hypothetical protein
MSEESDSLAIEGLPIQPVGLRPKETARAESSSLAEVYNRLNRGEYDALKDGASTLITIESIKRRRAAKLKPARFPDVVAGIRKGKRGGAR